MNVQVINFTQFLDYFTSWYPILVPSALLTVVILGCIIDWVRVFLVRYVDDFETQVEYKWWKFVSKVTGEDSGRNYFIAGNKYVFKVNNFWKYIYTKDSELAQEIDDHINQHGKTSAYCGYYLNDRVHATDGAEFYHVPNLAIQLPTLCVLLLVFKLLPLVITITIAIGYVVLLTARSIVRLTKKFKAHINDVNAHKEEE